MFSWVSVGDKFYGGEGQVTKRGGGGDGVIKLIEITLFSHCS